MDHESSLRTISILFILIILFILAITVLHSQLMKHQKDTGLKALRYLTFGPKTMEEIAKHLGIPTLEAKILLAHYQDQHMIESRYTTPWDSNGNRQEVKSVFSITDIGSMILKQNAQPNVDEKM
jgi:hypothetical protein